MNFLKLMGYLDLLLDNFLNFLVFVFGFVFLDSTINFLNNLNKIYDEMGGLQHILYIQKSF